MSVERIQPRDAAVRSLALLGLDPDFNDLFSPEGLSASLRRAASFLCPATPRQLVDAVLDVLGPLSSGLELEREDVAEALDSLVDVGDLLELRAPDGGARLLFLGPPSYVEKEPGHYLLFGIRPNARLLVDEESLGVRVAYERHTRLVVRDADGAEEMLATGGLHRLTLEQWTKAPRLEPASSVIERASQRLVSTGAPGHIQGLMVIDPASSVRYYKGRWRELSPADEGVFVGRRPQAYGAPIWCVLRCTAGIPQAVIDLPVDQAVGPGWDEARRLQAAIDAERGNPQIFHAKEMGALDGDWMFDFFGPLPSWADRYLDVAGLPVIKSRGALFSYRVPNGARGATHQFLIDALWMQATEDV